MLSPPTWYPEDGLFRAWFFDPLVATVSFSIWIHIYWYQERKRGLSSDNTFAQTIGFDWGPLYNSVASYWIGVYLFKCVVPPPAEELPDGIPHDFNDLLYLLLEVVSGIVLYDFFMFFLHCAMHECVYVRWMHGRHHDQVDGHCEARDTLRHSILDGSLQVLVNIAVQRHTPWGAVKSRLARALHNLVVPWCLVESHTASPTPYIWRRWLVGVREHRLHHMGGRNTTDDVSHQIGRAYGRYHRHQQFFGYLDDARAWYCEYERQRRKMHDV